LANETNTDLIRKHEREITRLISEAASLKIDMDRAASAIGDADRLTRELDKRFAVLTDRVDRLEKRLDELSARRWDILKIVISAVVGAALTLAGFLAKAALDRPAGPQPTPATPASSERK
jgi:hypothetical protein